MALPDVAKYALGSPQISIRDHAGGSPPTAGEDLEVGTPTDVEMNPGTLASGSLYQSDDFDFSEFWSTAYLVKVACEWSVAPTAGGAVRVYIGPNDALGATGLPGGLSDAKGAYNGYGAAAADAIEALPQLDQVGRGLIVTNDATIQVASLGVYVPIARYGVCVIYNNTSQAFGPDDNEFQIVFTPINLQQRDS